MAKYHFTQGQIVIDEGAFAPIPTKSEQNMRLSVFLILRKRSQPQKLIEEKPDVQTEKQE